MSWILEESHSTLPFKVHYTFKEDSKSYTCILTYDQYKNFKELPIINNCKIIKNDEKILNLTKMKCKKH